MATTPTSPILVRRPPPPHTIPPQIADCPPIPAPRRLASNFVALGIAEIACRGISMVVTLSLTKRLEPAGYGRIEFAFNIVFWLVLLLRDGFEVISTREIARHPRLIRPLVNHLLAVKGLIAVGLLGALIGVGTLTLTGAEERTILTLYGLMLLTTALGLDFVYRGMERMGLIAVSLMIRSGVYAAAVTFWVADASRATWVPACLVLGEVTGIALVWICYIRQFGMPRPTLGGSRFVKVILRRGRSAYLIQVSQAVIGSADLLIVGLMSRWADVGIYGAPHRLVSAVLTFGMIFQQVVFPSLARSWRASALDGRKALDSLVRVLTLGLVPLAIGTTLLAEPLVRYLLPTDYSGAGLLLALGIWRAPLLTLAYLYQTTLIALNREVVGVRLLVGGAIGSAPLVAGLRWGYGLPGAEMGVILIGLVLVVAGYCRLSQERRSPAWHHHLVRPLIGSAVMVPVCMALQGWHVLLAIAGGALAYFATLMLLGGIRKDDLRMILRRG
jgi:O-antigen/teichoic acid export membrane protein